MKYVVCVPDGCADEPSTSSAGARRSRRPRMPTLDALAARGEVGRAAVIPAGPARRAATSGNMSILGYDPAALPHRPGPDRGRRPRPAARARPGRLPLQPRHRRRRRHDGRLRRRPPVAPRTAAEVIDALDAELGGDGIAFHPGVQYRHILVAPGRLGRRRVRAAPRPDRQAGRCWPTGPAAAELHRADGRVPGRRRRLDLAANQVWLWGQGRQPQLPSLPRRATASTPGSSPPSTSSGASACSPAWRSSRSRARPAGTTPNYEGKRDAALGRAGRRARPVRHPRRGHRRGRPRRRRRARRSRPSSTGTAASSPAWSTGLDALGPWRLLLLPDHPTPLAPEDPHHRLRAVPAGRLGDRRPGRRLHRAGDAAAARRSPATS